MSTHTEKEAKTRWCPFVRAAYPADTLRMRPDIGENVAEKLPAAAVGNRPVDGNCHCIASQCMAWRWRDDSGESQPDGTIHYADFDQGYCGLAGKPQP